MEALNAKEIVPRIRELIDDSLLSEAAFAHKERISGMAQVWNGTEIRHR